MKTFKSSVAIILIASLILTLIGCGKADGEQTTEPTTQAPAYTDSVINNPSDSTVQAEPQSQPANSTQASESAAQSDPPTSQAETKATEPPTIEQTAAPAPETSAPASTQQSETQAPTTPAESDGVLKYTSSYNGTEQAVFYPEEASKKGAYPIVAWANGTGVSYTFYEELLRAIAKGGYIVVANTVSMAADGTAQIASIDFIIGENSNPESPLYKKINTNKIAVSGHSQGGRCAVNVASVDPRVSCVLSVAGSNYIEEAEKNSLPSLFLTGTSDWIVGSDRWVKPAYEACKAPAVYASYIGGSHTTCCSDIESYSYYSIKWFDAYLKNDASAKQIFKAGGQLSQDAKWQDFMCKDI